VCEFDGCGCVFPEERFLELVSLRWRCFLLVSLTNIFRSILYTASDRVS
jgi:hypothetical protein